MPAGTAVEQRVTDGERQLVIQTEPPRTVAAEGDNRIEVLRASPVPQRYQQFDTSRLELTVEARKNHVDLRLAAVTTS